MELMTIDQAAKYLQLHRQTLWRLSSTGQIPGAIRVGGSWRIVRHLLDEQFEEASKHD